MRALAVLCAASLLAGCTIFGVDIAPPGAFNDINALVEELDIPSVGEVTYEGRYGTVGNYRPTYVAVIEGTEVVDTLQGRLDSAGFEWIGRSDEFSHEWVRGGLNDYISVTLRIVKAGDGISVGADKHLKVEADSVAVYINE